MAHVRIYDRICKMNIDWYDIEESELDADLADIESKSDYYKDCDIIVNGNILIKL